MKKTSWPFYLFYLCGLLLLACQDDNDSGVTPPGNGDTFEGSQYVITLQDETENFHYPEFICTMRTEDGTVITRRGGHIRLDGQSILTLDTGLKEGIYRLLYLTTPVVTEAEADTTWNEYGLGCRIEISKGTVRVLDPYNKTANLSGNGTAEDPFIISSYDHLKRLRSMTNDQTQNKFLTASTYFLQIADINMDKAMIATPSSAGYRSVMSLTIRSGVFTMATAIRSKTCGPPARTPPGSPSSVTRRKPSLNMYGWRIPRWKGISRSAHWSEGRYRRAICVIRPRSLAARLPAVISRRAKEA